MTDTFPCPKCNRTLSKSGEFAIDGQTFPVFQCDECLAQVHKYGEVFEIAFTFALNAQGEPFCPATDDGELPL
jgi:hypothetical protein